ncbi:DUF2924 domain-containing protein [Aminobacter sp. MDW-2]|uniref:DUF2924 domain-containing protein n=1 Tax=Aminobacter sp. MDW-2 TaxID=2666139 RepID=UPI00163CFFA3|nr:DUF2924 domain-containing protein [Aminobacter sp. MDW-2]QNH35641.1 DUF2924 domain-containing protein [Aminobacter sp. MDW-2]
MEQELAELDNLSRDELGARWQKQHGYLPPTGMRRALLIRSAAWHLQAKRLGGYSAETRRRLKIAMADVSKTLADRRADQHVQQADGARSTVALADDAYSTSRSEPPSAAVGAKTGNGSLSKPKRRDAQPGARLIRDWNGRTHVVDVIEGGYVFEAKLYSSLTAVTRKITGTHWSGPRFFGLVTR